MRREAPNNGFTPVPNNVFAVRDLWLCLDSAVQCTGLTAVRNVPREAVRELEIPPRP